MKTVYFVRHGESETNLANVFGGRDAPLTERGFEQAREAGTIIAGLPHVIDVIISSTFLRAQQTAYEIADALQLPRETIVSDKRIIEIDDGKLDGVVRTPETDALRDHSVLTLHNEHEVEYIGDIVTRIEQFAADLLERAEDTILIVGHGFSGRTLRRVLAHIEPTTPLEQLANAEVIRLIEYQELEPGRRKTL